MNIVGGIYKITSPSGKIYVGSTRDFKDRFQRHSRELRLGTHGNAPLLKAWKKYFGIGFIFQPILICDEKDLLFYEQRAINILCPEYNVCKIAGNHLGVKRSHRTRQLLSIAHKGKILSEEHKRKIGLASSQRRASKEQKRRVSESLRKTMSRPDVKARMIEAAKRRAANIETRKKISESLTGLKRSEETRRRMSEAQKKVIKPIEVGAKISMTKLLRALETENGNC